MSSPNRRIDMGFDEVLHKFNFTLLDEGWALPANFGFRWAGVRFEGRIHGDVVEGLVMTIKACLGRLPYTAENAAARHAARQALNEAFRIESGKYHLASDGSVSFEAVTFFTGPLTSETVLQVLTVSLLQIRPFLKRFEGLLERPRSAPAMTPEPASAE